MRVSGYSKSPARQMAQDIVDLAQEIGIDSPVMESHLIQRGWHPAQIVTHKEAARHLAHRTLCRAKRAA